MQQKCGSFWASAALDAQKAFDVVEHDKLKIKLHEIGVVGRNWELLDSLYTNIKQTTRWNNKYSRCYIVEKGIRQGAVTSTSLYKLYINNLLTELEKSQNGICIGTSYLRKPACADDQLLLATSHHDLQAMLNSCHEYARHHGYVIHPEKSSVTELIGDTNQNQLAWKLGESNLNKTQTFTHLGLEWSSGNLSPNIEGRIKIARRATYALMGTRLHGANGRSPAVAVKIINTYVIPRLLYILDAVVLNKKQIEQICIYHHSLLRQIQRLPKSTAIEFTYLLSGTLQVEAELDIRRLTLFGTVCRGAETNCTLRKLAQRQQSMENKHNWFQLLLATAVKYNINIETALESPWSKYMWKQYVNKVVRDYWCGELINSNKPSLEILNKRSIQVMTPHPTWKVCTSHPRLVRSQLPEQDS